MPGRVLTICLAVVALGAAAASADEPRPTTAPTQNRGLGGHSYRDVFQLSVRATEFLLTWRDLQWNSELVYVDGKLRTGGRDYLIDYPSGSLHLKQPAASGSLVEVVYRIQPVFASPNVPPRASAPDIAGMKLEPHRAATNSRSIPSLAAHLGRALYSPARIVGPPTELEATATGPAPAGDLESLRTQLLTGLRETTLQEQIVGDGRDRAAVSYLRSDPVDPRTFGSGQEELNTQLDLHPSPTSRLLWSNYLSRSSMFTDSYQYSERQQLQFQQTWNKSSVDLLWERRRSDGNGVADSLDALSLSLTQRVTSSLSAEGLLSFENSLYRGWSSRNLLTLRQQLGRSLETQVFLSQRYSGVYGPGFEGAVSVYAHPNARTTALVSAQESRSLQYGRYGRLSSSVTTSVADGLQFSAEASQRTSDRYGNVSSYGLGMAARPTARTLLEAAFSESTGDRIGRERARTLRLTTDPTALVKIQLGYDLLTSSASGATQNALWIVTVGDRRYLKVEGTAGLYALTGADPFSDQLYRVEVRPIGALALNGGIHAVEMDQIRRTLGNVGGTLYISRGVDVSATYRRPAETVADPQLYGGDVKLHLAPVPGFQFFGQYSRRPEDERGYLLDQTEQTLGVEARLGSFALSGSQTNIAGVLAGTPGVRRDVLASLNFAGGTRLYGGLSREDNTLSDALQKLVYRAGISQMAGQSFFLMLEGQVSLLVDSAGARTLDPVDTRAQARLGLRF